MLKNNKNSILSICKFDLIDTSLFINWNDKEREKIFKKLNEEYSIKELAKMLNHDETTLYQIRTGEVKPSTKLYFSFLDILKIRVKITSLRISSRNAAPIKIKNNYISPELVGLIHSDGHLNLIKSKNGQIFYFSNQHRKLIDRFCDLIGNYFDCIIYIKLDRRDNTYYAYPPSVVGRVISKKIGWKTKDYDNLDFSVGEIPYYLTGLFDGDGTIYIYKNSKITIPTIKITTNSNFHAQHIKYLLNRIGIYSRISPETRKNWRWFNVVITKQKDFLKFIKMVNSKHPNKRLKIDNYLSENN